MKHEHSEPRIVLAALAARAACLLVSNESSGAGFFETGAVSRPASGTPADPCRQAECLLPPNGALSPLDHTTRRAGIISKHVGTSNPCSAAVGRKTYPADGSYVREKSIVGAFFRLSGWKRL